MAASDKTFDFVVIGGGILGLSIAREIKRRYHDAAVVILEKEKECGLHASARNSGVLHAGFYYSADSLKAKFTRLGNQVLTQYCESKKLPINKCGKLVVAKDAGELKQLDELLRRGRLNGVPLEEISESEAHRIEPRVKTYQKAIFSPTTSSVDPVQVVQAIKEDALEEGIAIHEGVQYLKKSKGGMLTSAGLYDAGFVVNCAGLYADKVALDFGFSRRYRIVPFKGLYLYSDEPAGSLKTNVYPVPDLRNPFLGVHFTVLADGRVKIGPTAIPALWREQYSLFENFKLSEFVEVVSRELGLFLFSDFGFQKLAFEETLKQSSTIMVRLASKIMRDVKPSHYRRWGSPGIRAQLVDIKLRKLVMDFVVEGDSKSIHILNAVSPGFTCAIPFSQHVCDKIAGERSKPPSVGGQL